MIRALFSPIPPRFGHRTLGGLLKIGIVCLAVFVFFVLSSGSLQAQLIETPTVTLSVTKTFSLNPLEIAKNILGILFDLLVRIFGRFLQPIIEFLEAPVDEPLPKIEELSGLLPADDDYSFEGQAEKILNLLQEASFMQTQIPDKEIK